ncbi:MAG: hypothetical protein GJ676_08695 [Rhodobacteraceae bacterium]|nr:hypothetical protein [Paracoccaceae bacterium]
MNFPQGLPEDREEHEIILIGIERSSYFLFKGEAHINQILLADGTFPKPILCMHFENSFDANLFIGDGASLGSFWAIHPEIVARLRADKDLVETDA